MPVGIEDTRALLLVVLDFDGDTELLCGPERWSSSHNRIYQNDRMGRFVDVTATHWPKSRGLAVGFVYGDVDQDGDFDVVTNDRWNVSIYLNDGTGRFRTMATSNRPFKSSASKILMTDVDGDGDPDLLCSYVTYAELYINDGMGTFTDATATW